MTHDEERMTNGNGGHMTTSTEYERLFKPPGPARIRADISTCAAPHHRPATPFNALLPQHFRIPPLCARSLPAPYKASCGLRRHDSLCRYNSPLAYSLLTSGAQPPLNLSAAANRSLFPSNDL